MKDGSGIITSSPGLTNVSRAILMTSLEPLPRIMLSLFNFALLANSFLK